MSKKTAKKKVAKKVARKTESTKASVNQAQDYAHEIWLAGLGAFALAQEEGGRIFKIGTKAIDDTSRKVLGESSKLFERLVEEGSKLENKGRKLATDAVGGVRGDVERNLDKVRESAQSNWDKLEKVFEQRVARALARLGVPTSDEISKLSDRVAELNKRVAELAKKQEAKAAAPKPAPKAPAPAPKAATEAKAG